MTTPHRLRGVTLVELMVTLSIAVILLTIAVPSFQHLVFDARRASLTNTLAGSLQQARAEAMGRGQSMVVCAVDDSDADTPRCVDTTDWSNGWMVFACATQPCTDIGSDDTLLRVVRPGPGKVAASIKGPVTFEAPLGEIATTTEITFTISTAAHCKRTLTIKRNGHLSKDRGRDCYD
ncbi:GspH/FimT family pseudopilin [Marichromatium bheemlicum]|uniref:Type II secretion system protein H n=1 Tax=Marichromatium bheemlicum TaxID=365339 RepID=A0ABX1I345_9GAMM|nr:GspH/FimT family pseudopilin [Marichromatium bheemlicum]NKN31667.1 prepilin-type N-terminal cleavage/methylation domain-containing protein [Marichromatium bheemlicum]